MQTIAVDILSIAKLSITAQFIEICGIIVFVTLYLWKRALFMALVLSLGFSGGLGFVAIVTGNTFRFYMSLYFVLAGFLSSIYMSIILPYFLVGFVTSIKVLRDACVTQKDYKFGLNIFIVLILQLLSIALTFYIDSQGNEAY